MANNKVLELIKKGKSLQALEELGDSGLLHRYKDLTRKSNEKATHGNIMKLKFADGTEIETPKKESVIEFLYRNYPKYLAEYCAYLDRNNRAFRLMDAHGRREK